MAEQLPWLRVHSHELTASADARAQYATLAESIGERAQHVPAFLFCGQMLTGFDAATGNAPLRTALLECKSALDTTGSFAPATPNVRAVPLPWLGDADLSKWSLPLTAITLGALDSFNPCAFFVLLFLLSLLVNARSRGRIVLIGALFVTVSGVVYFVFMAAWLNVFLVVGELSWITLLAGCLALLIGALNVKDYFAFQRGPSLKIPDSAKPGLFHQMRRLVGVERLPALISGTLLLAVVANSYELLCTAGFPMVFTRILTLAELRPAAYYGYLGLYCAVYVIPLLAIVAFFAATLGRRKLTEHQGRVLKLLSGVMMAMLGALLVAKPQLLNNIGVTLALLVTALAVVWLITRLSRKRDTRGPAI